MYIFEIVQVKDMYMFIANNIHTQIHTHNIYVVNHLHACVRVIVVVFCACVCVCVRVIMYVFLLLPCASRL